MSSIISCLTTRVYYPYLDNGYNNEIIIKVIFYDGDISHNKLSVNGGLVMMEENRVFKSIEVFDTNKNLLAFYPKEYLDKEREKVIVEKEMWIVYEGGLVLIPDEYRRGKKWQVYI